MAPDPWAIGTPITETHPLHATIMAWASVEKTLEEWNIPQAEQRAKAIVARLAVLDPPVLTVHPHEMKDESEVSLRDAAMAAHDAIYNYLVVTYGDPNEHEPEWYDTHEGPWMRAPQSLLEALKDEDAGYCQLKFDYEEWVPLQAVIEALEVAR